LTGAARVARTGKPKYRVGDLLSDSIAVFVWESAMGEADATSHYEKLEQSKCKQASGAKLGCVTCHDPHSAAPAAQRAEHYRQACQTCHATKPCTANAGNDCAGCHMPNRQTKSVDHLAYTDHSIARRPGASSAPSGARVLTPFWKGVVDERDLALGYAVVAPGEPAVRPRALGLLEKAATASPNDVAILVQLAQFYDRMGREEQALALCERIVKLDPTQTGAAVNLGIYRMKRGQAAEAIQLWEGALQRNPGLTGARINLAVAQYRAGNRIAAEAALVKALEYEPDSEVARRMLDDVRSGR
jgi:predicted CXXCH cytochrome family protein